MRSSHPFVAEMRPKSGQPRKAAREERLALAEDTLSYIVCGAHDGFGKVPGTGIYGLIDVCTGIFVEISIVCELSPCNYRDIFGDNFALSYAWRL